MKTSKKKREDTHPDNLPKEDSKEQNKVKAGISDQDGNMDIPEKESTSTVSIMPFPINESLTQNEDILALTTLSSRVIQWAEDLEVTDENQISLSANAVQSIQKIKNKIEKIEDSFILPLEEQIESISVNIKNIKEFFSGIMGPLEGAEEVINDKISKCRPGEKEMEDMHENRHA